MSRKLLLLLAALTLMLPTTVFAAPEQETTNDYVVVLLKDPPIGSYEGGINGLERTKPLRGKLDPTSPAYEAYQRHLADQRANYHAFLNKNAPRADVLAEYDDVLNGIALELNGTDPAKLLQDPNARAVVASWLYEPTMNVSVDLIEAAAVWGRTGGQANAGSGISVGIIDTGIRDDHFFFDCKDDIPHKVYASGVAGTGEAIVFNHGTHVAGTVAGCVTTLTDGPITGTISGVAPGASLFDYNVFPGFGGGFVAFGGSAFSHDIVEALEDTVEDGMDVVNMSLGGGVQGPHDLLAEAVSATVDAGVVVAVAAGNSGPSAGTVESPGNSPEALTAGASTNPHFIGIPVTVGTETFGAAVGDFESFGNVKNRAYTVTSPADGCSAITNDVAGKIALIDRGVCTFTTKVRNAQDAGAIGVLVVNNVAGDPTAMAHDGTDPKPTIPAAMLSQGDGNAIKPSGTLSVDGRNPTEFVTENADIIAGFSSRGPGPFLSNIKPDITGPGVNVYSSVFDEETGELGFAMFSGTSMATPHAAGSAALLLDLYGGPGSISPADVKSLLGNSAFRPVTDDVTGVQPTGVMTRGGGRIDLAQASTASATFDPMSLSFGSHRGNKQVSVSIPVTVRNLSASSQTFTITVGDPNLSLDTSSLTVAGGGTGTFTVSLSVRGVTDTFEGDVSVSNGGRTYLVPFWYSVGN